MSDRARPRVVYVLPNDDARTGTHFFHIYELLDAASRDLDLFLVIERPASSPAALALPTYRQRFAFPPLRFLELLAVLLRERIRGRKFSYTHYSFFGALASWLAFGLTGGVAYYWNCGMPWRYRRPWLEEAVFRLSLRRTILVTGTPGLARGYARHYGLLASRIRTLPNWVNTHRFAGGDQNAIRHSLGIPQDAKVVLFVHHLSRRKGSHRISEIASGVRARVGSAIFIIVGDGPESGRLQAALKRSGLEDSVRLVGSVPNRDIPQYLRAADVFVMPSEEEGFPNVLLEAMASGLPFVATDVGGVREITPPDLEHSVVAPDDTARFILEVVAILTLDPIRRESIRRALEQWAIRNDTSAIVPQFVALFQK